MTISNRSSRTAGRILVALLATVALTTVAAIEARAQQAPPAAPPASQPKAQPKAQPKGPAPAPAPQAQTPAPPTPPPMVQQQAPQLIFSPWVKLCNKDPNDPNAKRICVTVKDGRVETGLLVVSVALIEMDGETRKLIRISMPYGVALQHGTRMIVDQDTPATSPFITCLPPAVPPGGCIADYEASNDLIAKMKKGQYLTVQAIHMNGQAMSPQLQLNDFAKAYDGPPTDPKVFEEQQKKLQEGLQERAKKAQEELQKKQTPAAPK
jgi:invasion protein IalB